MLAWPDAAPVVSVFGPDGLIIRTELAADSQGLPPGHFRLGVFLGANFPESGWLYGHFQWDDGVAHVQAFTARLLPGGSPNGSVIAMKYVRRPAANFVVYQTDAGFVMKGTNPRV